MVQKKSNVLAYKTAREAADEARHELDTKKDFSGVQCRWPKWNSVLTGGFRLKNVYMIAAMSGAGKSYFINNLMDDFTNPSINQEPAIVLHFGFEMLSSDEALRFSQRGAKLSYGQMVDPNLDISEEEKKRINVALDDFAKREIYIVETAGDLSQIWNTQRAFRKEHPNRKLFITWDHTLLARHKNEKDDIELLANIGKMSIDGKKYLDAGYILLNQLNAEMEEPRRITDRRLHYPTKRDIHGSKQIYWACDGVCVLNRPEMLNIARYGSKEAEDGDIGYPTKDLVAAHWLKVRKGSPGLIRMRQQLHFGTFQEWNANNNMNRQLFTHE